MSRSIRFFTSSGFDSQKLLGRRRTASASTSPTTSTSTSTTTTTSSRKSSRSSSKEEENDSLLYQPSASTISLASTTESSATSLDGVSVAFASSLCLTAQEHRSLSQRVIVRMNRQAWNVSTRRGDSIACLQFPHYRDEILLHDMNGQECGVIIPTRSSTAAIGRFEYNVYSFHPSSKNQRPTMESNVLGVPSFYHYARFCAEQDHSFDCFRFHCFTHQGRQFQADKIVWSTFQSWAFCIKEIKGSITSTSSNAARVTCLANSERELLVYPRVDPILMVAFVAVMEEVVLVTNL